jgi:hypothetical protein
MPNEDMREARAEERLAELFREYREACETPEAGAGFMPALWEKIEARQTLFTVFGRFSKALVTCALAASVMMGVYVALPGNHLPHPFYTASYVEILAVDEALQTAEYAEPVHAESAGESHDADFELL